MVSRSDNGSARPQQLTHGGLVIRELLDTLEDHARGMWRYRWRAVVLVWIVSIAGWATVYSMPPVYEASARVFVDTENALRPLLQGIATSSDILSEVAVVTREMLSRPNLAVVARDTDLNLEAETDDEFERLLVLLQNQIRIEGDRDNVFLISFQHPDRAKAIAVVDSLLNTFIERSLGADRNESSRAQAFLQSQIHDYEARLTAAEDNLASFKRDNVAFMPDQRGDYFSTLQFAETALVSTQDQLRLAQERRLEILRQLEGEEPVFGIMPSIQPETSGGTGAAAAKIRELEIQLEELRLQYTDRHPRIGQILETIKLLKVQQELERSAAAASGTSNRPSSANPLDINPVYQNMRIQLSNTEVEVASLSAEARQQRKRVIDLKTLVDTVPQVEADLSRLNRDYDVVRTKYEQLLAQLERARIGEDVEQSIDEVKFRIIDPPFAALRPVGPRRHLLLAVVLIAAIGLGGALMFLLNQLHPVYFSSRAVTSTSGVPVLGIVSLSMSPDILRDKRRGNLILAMMLGLLLVSFAAIYLYVEQLLPLFREIMRLDS